MAKKNKSSEKNLFDCRRTVYHFFNAKTTHHVPKFLKYFSYFHKETISKGCFVLFNFSPEYNKVYEKFERELRLIYIDSKLKMLQIFLNHYFNDESIFVLHGFNRSYFLCNFLLPLKKRFHAHIITRLDPFSIGLTTAFIIFLSCLFANCASSCIRNFMCTD